ncbi:MAG: hypothetical protein LT067_06930 [Sulfurovum sp.]|jgi:hypothetical protein|nr:hypothetical protein [Sulfurovum sp.]
MKKSGEKMTSKEQKLLAYLQEAFDESVRLTKGSREEGRDAYEYMRGNQLPEYTAAQAT